ncbi:hypothetical protein [Nocardia carnea]|uniref:hypothetical protein n=1 Tax=Nocardia carnea TaxID=37328 RepID=UPI002457BFAC|nr:hypothetical protein [Nocardia carnea]
MTNLTDPAYYDDCATAEEAEMRAAFAQMCMLRHRITYTDSLAESEQLLEQAAAIERRWTLPDGSLFSDWAFLSAAVTALLGPQTFTAAKDLTALAAVTPPAVDDDTVLPIHHRSRRQAAELATWIHNLPESA